MTKEITTIQKKISPLAQRASTLEISTTSDLREATALLSLLNQYNDNIQEEKEKVTKPLLEALKQERLRWKPAETMYEESIQSLRFKMSTYQTIQVKTKKEEEQKIANRVSKGTLKIETAVKKIEAIMPVEKEYATDVGLVQFRETQILKITNIDLIPRQFFDLNESSLLKNLKMGVKVLGAEIETIQVPVNYR